MHNVKKAITDSVKRTTAHVDTCASCLDVNSLSNFKKQKCLKASIKASFQSCLCLAIDQQKDKTTNPSERINEENSSSH